MGMDLTRWFLLLLRKLVSHVRNVGTLASQCTVVHFIPLVRSRISSQCPNREGRGLSEHRTSTIANSPTIRVGDSRRRRQS